MLPGCLGGGVDGQVGIMIKKVVLMLLYVSLPHSLLFNNKKVLHKKYILLLCVFF